MNKRNKYLGYIIVLIGLTLTIFSCKKPVDEFPDTNEPISFIGIDSSTIRMKAGQELELDVVLVTDAIIETLKIGYLIDTVGITYNITYADIKKQLVVKKFKDESNKYVYSASLKLPANAYGLRAFKPYKNNKGDYVRMIFRMETKANPKAKIKAKSYEKQLKIIMEP